MDCAQTVVAGRFGLDGCSGCRRRLAAGSRPILGWRTVKRMSERLHFEARGKFQLEASRALFRRSGVLVGIVIAAEVVMYMLRLWAAR